MVATVLYLLIALAAAVGVLLVIAARRPDDFYAARSMKIAAPVGHLHALINDLRQMNRWNPYALRQKDGGVRYSGPEAGPGATFHFDGRGGTGYVSVTDSSPSLVGMRLVMTKPIAGDNRVEFQLKPAGAETEVTWAMRGAQTMPGKILSLFVNCERMMARDFDEGLANLKAIAEA